MNDNQSFNIEGCSSGGCIFKTDRSGVHSNGGCQCAKDLARTENGRKAIRFIWELKHKIEQMEIEDEEG